MKKALKIKSESNNLKINYDSIYELDSKKLIKLLTSMAAALYRKQHVEKLVLLLNHQKKNYLTIERRRFSTKRMPSVEVGSNGGHRAIAV